MEEENLSFQIQRSENLHKEVEIDLDKVTYQKDIFLKVNKIMKHNIEEVWTELRDMPRWKSKQSYHTNFKVITPDLNPWQVGCRYRFLYKEFIHLGYETRKVVSEPSFKQIVAECFLNSLNNIGFIFEYKLYKITSNNTTLLQYTITYVDEMAPDIQELINTEKLELFRLNSKYLSKLKLKTKEQSETCILSVRRDKVWEVLKDLRLLHEISPELATNIIYNGELKSLSNIKFTYEDMYGGLTVDFIVDNISENEKEEIFSMKFVKLKDNILYIASHDKKDSKCKKKYEYYVPFQEIIIEARRISKSKTMVVFKHFFCEKDKISKEIIKEFSKAKLAILQKIKEYFSIKKY